MRIELTRTFPVPLKKGFDYLDDYTTWPAWYTGVMEIIEPEKAAWSSPGDKVRFAYKLLGRRLEGECVLDEVKEAELVRFTAHMPAIGDIHQDWLYGAAGDDAFTVKVTLETDEPTQFFGKMIDKTIIPRILERDLRHTLDHLEETFAMGIPE